MFLPFLIVDGGFFLYAGDFNSQQIAFYQYANQFAKTLGTFSWATDLGSGFLNSYSFYLIGSPFWWLSLLFPSSWLPYLMVPLLCLKFAVAGAGAYLWMRRYTVRSTMAVLGGCLYALAGSTVYNVFFNHFVDVIALFPFLLWALDEAVLNRRRGWFAVLVALNALNNYFFFAGQVVFLCLYFCCMVLSGRWPITWRRFWHLALESVLGVAISCIILIPTVLSLSENPRVSSFSDGFGLLLYGKPQQYAAILYSLFFMPDCPYMPAIFTEGTIKWTSMTAYLPLISMAPAIAYWRSCKKDGFRWILNICLVMALVPGLNSAFYAMNSSYYARWYYMPVLILCAVSVCAMEHPDKIDMKKGIVPTLVVLLAYTTFALVPTQNEENWQIGVMSNPAKFWVAFGMSMLGVLVFWYLWRMGKNNALFPRRMTAAVLAFGCLYGVVHISIGKFAQWNNDKDYRQQQYVDARALAKQLPEGAYRVDDFESYDNLGLWLNCSDLQTFNSTVAPSILEFYPLVGVKRDVRSAPEMEDQALRQLLGVRFTITPVEHQEELEEILGDNWQYYTTQGSLAVYENTDALPMVTAYDSYMTMEEYLDQPETSRSELLLRAVVLEPEQVNQYGAGLRHLTSEEQKDMSDEAYQDSIRDRRDMGANQVELTNTGLRATIAMSRAGIVQLAVPYDPGFSATVNGNPVEVLKVSGGLTAVCVPSGSVEIQLTYQPQGFVLGAGISGVAVVFLAGYWLVTKSRKKQ